METSYETEKDALTWRFENVAGIYPLFDERIQHGAEVFSRFLRDSEAMSLLTRFEDR